MDRVGFWRPQWKLARAGGAGADPFGTGVEEHLLGISEICWRWSDSLERMLHLLCWPPVMQVQLDLPRTLYKPWETIDNWIAIRTLQEAALHRHILEAL